MFIGPPGQIPKNSCPPGQWQKNVPLKISNPGRKFWTLHNNDRYIRYPRKGHKKHTYVIIISVDIGAHTLITDLKQRINGNIKQMKKRDKELRNSAPYTPFASNFKCKNTCYVLFFSANGPAAYRFEKLSGSYQRCFSDFICFIINPPAENH